MNPKPPKPILLICILLGFTSCVAYQSGGISSDNPGKDFVYEDLAVGVATSTRFLGLGGTRKDALILEAKRQLTTNRPLKKNEEYINYIYDFKRSFYLFVDQTKVTLTADVITHTSSAPSKRYSAIYKNKVFKLDNTDAFLKLGDSVTTTTLESMVILSKHNNRYTTFFKNEKDEFTTRRYYSNELYNVNTTYKNIAVGDNILYNNGSSKYQFTVEVLGFGRQGVLVKDNLGSTGTIKYSELKTEKTQ